MTNLLVKEIIENGGFTYCLNEWVLKSEGLVYSPFLDRTKVLKIEEMTEEILHNYISDNLDKLTLSTSCLGAWHDKETNLVHLDISIIVNCHNEAIQGCITHNQLAYYDMAQGKEIYVTQELVA